MLHLKVLHYRFIQVVILFHVLQQYQNLEILKNINQKMKKTHKSVRNTFPANKNIIRLRSI